MKYRFKPDIELFLRNKKENIRKLMKEDRPNLRCFYLFDNDYMWKVNKNIQQISVWYMGNHQNYEMWRISYALSDLEE